MARLTHPEFLKRALAVHGYQYEYPEEFHPKYSVKVLNVQSMPLLKAWRKEDQMKKFLKNNKMLYHPANKLISKGSTECFRTKMSSLGGYLYHV